ncbi:MAG: MFS transporter [Planctomycetota bacterium]|jgi:ACS family glucarate transporter-like MFS transporter
MNASSQKRTHQRHLLVGLLFLHAMNTFMDRICISTASDLIMTDLNISSQTMGYVFAIFAVSYALLQVPAGWFADAYGPKKALLIVVGFWSSFTALTGAAWNAVSMLVIRFFFGAGEAGAFPGATRAVFNWVPSKERGLANGIFHSGGRVGAALSLLLMPFLIRMVGWRWTFVINGAIGIVWAIVWLVWFRNHPKDHPGVNDAERDYIESGIQDELTVDEKVPFGLIITSPNMVLAMVQYIAGNMTFFISLTWLFPYVKDQWGEGSEIYTPIPLLLGMIAHWSAGGLVSFLYSKGFHVASRRVPAIIGFSLGVIGLLLSIRMADSTALAFILSFSIAVFGVEMTIAPSWTFCMDIGGRKTGAVSGTMNMLGNLGSAASAVLFPYFVAHITIPYFAETTGNANSFFVFAAFLNATAIVSWIFMDPRKPIDTSVPKEKVRLRVILMLGTIAVLFVLLTIYKTFLLK